MENGERETWGKKMDFMLSCVGYAVGLGNLWRFPYLCMRNGGGAFLIPYLIFLVLCGIPLFFLELVIGQYSRRSPLGLWDKMCPIFKGVGYSSVMVSGIMCVYYNMILGWTLYYLAMSFTIEQLPWASCGNWWNTDACTYRMNDGIITSLGNGSNVSTMVTQVYTAATEATTQINENTSTAVILDNHTRPATPTDEFWNYNVLQLSSGLEDLGGFRWELFLCLMSAWIIIFLCLFRGIKTLGKVVYVTALGPYAMLLVFLIRGVTLDGAMEGIKFYLMPNFERLGDYKVWIEACSQIFYSLGPAYGTLITMSSYNKFNNNCYRDALLIPCINAGTSIIAGLVIFSVIGFMAKQTGLAVEDVAVAGPGLAFIVYPEALAQLPLSQLWAVLFFFMLLMIGLDTQFGMFETMTSGIVDIFPKTLNSSNKKTLFTGLMCVVQFMLGVPLVMQGGIYVFQLLDWYSATFSLITISFLECIIVGWIYGRTQIYDDIFQMIGYKPNKWWAICWCFITPFLLLVVLMFSLIMFSAPTYGDYVYPKWGVAIGWCIALVSLLPIPTMALHKFCQTKGTFMERSQQLFSPTDDFRPKQAQNTSLLSSIEKQMHITELTEVEADEKSVFCKV